MASESRVLIFGLVRGDSAADVLLLLGRGGAPRLEICDVPGDDEQVFAVVHLQPDPEQAWRLARRVEGSRLNGRRLQSWVPAMPWR